MTTMVRRMTITATLLLGLLTAGSASAQPAGWSRDVAAARKQAQAENKLILVDLYAEWCGWCKVLERDVFSAPAFRDYAKQFVLLQVDVEDGAEGSRLQARFDAGSLPTTLILDGKMALVGRISGFSPTPLYITKIQTELERHKQVMALYDQALASGKASELQQAANELHGRADGTRAAKLYERLIAASPAEAGEWRYRRADALRLAEEFEPALAAIEQGQKDALKADNKPLAERFDFLRSLVALDRGDCDKAMASLQSFLAQYPQSSLRGMVNRALNDLKQHPTVCG
jgi:thiol-disulfide isomerase/thioredoxin